MANEVNQTVVGANNAYTISGLDYNTNYSVKVIAVNSCGLQSEASNVEIYIEAKGHYHKYSKSPKYFNIPSIYLQSVYSGCRSL